MIDGQVIDRVMRARAGNETSDRVEIVLLLFGAFVVGAARSLSLYSRWAFAFRNPPRRD